MTLPATLNKGFLYPDYVCGRFAQAKIAILPVPLERTTSYGKGTSKGPRSILRASSFLERLDEETGIEVCTKGIATMRPLSFNKLSIKECHQKIFSSAEMLLGAKKKIVALGGEHSISAPLIRAHQSAYPSVTVLHLDAHADMRETYEDSKYSHACVMKRVSEMRVPLVQVGLRSLSKPELKAMAKVKSKVYWAHDIAGKTKWMAEAISALSKHVYVTIDVDVLDPSVMPATGTPEPGGLDWATLIRFLRKVSKQKRIVGADVVEFSPVKGLHYADYTAAKLVYKIAGMIN